MVGRLIGGMHGDEKCAASGPREADLSGAGVSASGSRDGRVNGEKGEPPLSEAECSVLLEAALAGLATAAVK